MTKDRKHCEQSFYRLQLVSINVTNIIGKYLTSKDNLQLSEGDGNLVSDLIEFGF